MLDDRRKGHSVDWEADGSGFLVEDDKRHDRAAVRAQDEYYKAAIAYLDGDNNAAAYYLGAMAHYIGDVSQYGHSIPDEEHHSDYESWVGNRTKSATHGIFEIYLTLEHLVRRTPYTAVKRISKATALGEGPILPGSVMDASYSNKDQVFVDSIGASLNKGVNELADVLHRFYLSYVESHD